MILERSPAGRRARLFAGSVHTFELPALAEALRAEEYYHWHGCDGVTLLETPELHVHLEVLRAGASAPAHPEVGALTIQVLDGELRFEAEEEILYLREGEVLILHTYRSHSLHAVSNVAMLATFSRTSSGAQSNSPGLAEPVISAAPTPPSGWEAVQDRYPADWPVEGGDEQC